MSGSAEKAILLESYDLNISAIVEENPGWSQRMVNDYFSKQSNINALAKISDTDSGQIVINKANIEVLQGQMTAITVVVGQNTNAIIVNAGAIVVVQNNLDGHESNDSAHGVSGTNVGTTDYCTQTVGGVVLLALSVADASTSTTTITTLDIAAAPVLYDQAYTDTQANLANECKAKINSIISDIDNIKNQLNEFIASSKAAKQMGP